MKSGSPSRTTAAHKTQTKIQAWSSLVFHCCHSSFNPSEAPPWDSRPVSGACVVHYQLLHRPRSVPTALGPAPLVTYPHRPSQAGGYSRDCALLPPSPLSRGEPVRASAAYLGVRTDEAREKETEGWGVTEKREGERGKKKSQVWFPDTLPLGPQPAERFTRGAMRWYWTSLVDGPMLLRLLADGGGSSGRGQPAVIPPSLLLPKHGGWQQASASRRTGATPPLPLGRQPPLLDPGARQRVFRPTCSSFAPAPPLRAATGGLRYFLLPDLLSTVIPLSSEGSLTACPSFLPGFGHQCNAVRRYGKKEAGTGEHSTHFNNKINKHKWKAAAPHGRLPHTKHKLKSRPGPLSSSTVVTPHLTLPNLLRGTRDRWVVQVSFITNYSTSLAPFPRLSAPPHSSQSTS